MFQTCYKDDRRTKVKGVFAGLSKENLNAVSITASVVHFLKFQSAQLCNLASLLS